MSEAGKHRNVVVFDDRGIPSIGVRSFSYDNVGFRSAFCEVNGKLLAE